MYDLPVHRYRELKHFCLQYDFMKEEINRLQNQLYLNEEDPTGYIAVKLTEYKNAVKLIETTAFNLGKQDEVRYRVKHTAVCVDA